MSLVVARKPAVFTTLPGPNRMPSRLMMKTRPLAVSVPMISDGPEPAGHAVERDRRGARLIEAHALVGADVERVPVDDRAAGRLVDDHRRAALALDGGGTADHRPAFGPGRHRRDPKRQQRRGGEQHAAHVRQACHVIAKRLAGCRIARGAGVAEDFGRSCRSSNEIVARSKTRGQVLRACPAENRLLQVRFLRPLVRWCHQQPNEFKRQIEEGVLLFQMDLSLPQ